MGKAFEKQIKTIEDQGKKQVDALDNLKPKKETKPIEDKSNNQSKAAIIFNKLINERKDLMKELHHHVDYNNLKFGYVSKNKDVSFYEYMDSKQFFSAIKNDQINFDDVLKRQNEFLNKLSNIKIGKKGPEQKEVINNLENFYKSREDAITFFRDYEKMVLDASYKSKLDETKGKGIKILAPKQMLQRLPIGIRQIVYSLYQSKQITKNVYNNIIKSLQ